MYLGVPHLPSLYCKAQQQEAQGTQQQRGPESRHKRTHGQVNGRAARA